jgi:hypothetical protein
LPDCLNRFDWREWRPPAPADHPDPSYVEWYLAVHDWQEAKDAWLAGAPVLLPPERPLPDPVPYTGMLPSIGAARQAQNDVPAEHAGRRIETYYRRRRTT